LGTEEIVAAIYAVLADRRKARRMVSDFLAKLSPEELERAVADGFDPWEAAVREFKLYDPGVMPVARMLLRANWRDIERELTDVGRIYRRLARKPGNRRVLSRPEAVRWLNETCVRSYDAVYRYCWEEG